MRGLWRRLLYRLYLLTPHWHAVRRRALHFRGHFCGRCGGRERLQVHHVRYRDARGSVLWRERMGDVTVLCRRCHAEAHGR